MDEQWRDVAGHEGSYQVSNLGRVRSLTRFIRQQQGSGLYYSRVIHPRIMRPILTTRGYLSVKLRGPRKAAFIHRLVLVAFVGNPRPGEQANHKDLNKQNNRADNLEWVTASANMQHAAEHGRWKDNITHRKLSDDEIKTIRELISTGQFSQRQLAARFNVSHVTIGDIKRQRRWLQVV